MLLKFFLEAPHPSTEKTSNFDIVLFKKLFGKEL